MPPLLSCYFIVKAYHPSKNDQAAIWPETLHCHMKGNDGFQYVLTLNVHSYPTLTPSFVSVYGQGKKGSQASHSIGQELELLPLDHCSTPVATALLTPVRFPRRKLPICFEHKFSETGIHACLKLLST